MSEHKQRCTCIHDFVVHERVQEKDEQIARLQAENEGLNSKVSDLRLIITELRGKLAELEERNRWQAEQLLEVHKARLADRQQSEAGAAQLRSVLQKYADRQDISHIAGVMDALDGQAALDEANNKITELCGKLAEAEADMDSMGKELGDTKRTVMELSDRLQQSEASAAAMREALIRAKEDLGCNDPEDLNFESESCGLIRRGLDSSSGQQIVEENRRKDDRIERLEAALAQAYERYEDALYGVLKLGTDDGLIQRIVEDLRQALSPTKGAGGS